jgi:hypothetical protein
LDSVKGDRTITTKQDGRVVGELKSSVSADERTLRNMQSGAWGQAVLIFERQ